MAFKVLRVGKRAVRKAQEENRKLGLPSVYSKNNRLFWELPDGTITSDLPEQFKD